MRRNLFARLKGNKGEERKSFLRFPRPFPCVGKGFLFLPSENAGAILETQTVSRCQCWMKGVSFHEASDY